MVSPRFLKSQATDNRGVNPEPKRIKEAPLLLPHSLADRNRNAAFISPPDALEQAVKIAMAPYAPVSGADADGGP